MSAFKFFQRIVLPIVLLAALAACAPPQKRTSTTPVAITATNEVSPSKVEQTFIIGIGRDPGPLNPRNYASQFPPLALVYEPLIVYNADGSLSPGLATSWESSDNGLTWTFHLRQGVTFHDGTAFDSKAAKWNFEQWVGVKRHSWIRASTVIDSIEAPDANTIVLKLKDQYYPLLQELALVRPVRFASPASVDAAGEFVKAIGTGPWKLDTYTPDQRETFVPNENYWGKKPTLTKLIFEVIPDPQTRIASLLSREVHLIGGEYIGGISLESVPVLKRNPQVQLITAQGSTGYMLIMNYKRPPFDDLNVRKALNLAIDRKTISDKVFQGLATPAQGVFAPNIPYVSYPHPEEYAHDPQKAQQLLKDAGWTPGKDGILEKDGKPFNITVVVDANVFPQAKSMAEVIQGELSEIGIKMDIRMTDYGGWSDALLKFDYDLATNITYGSPYDPQSTLTTAFTSEFLSMEGSVFVDPELDKLVADVLKTQDEAARKEIYTKIWNFFDEHAVAVPVVYSQRVYALDSRVKGFVLAGTEYELALDGVTIGE